MRRPNWDEIWMQFAKRISLRSHDPRFQVGCCIVTKDNCQVLAIGYNGDHKGGPNKHESPEPGHSGFIHAEINALIKCDYNNLKPRKIYVTLAPCKMCAKAIINAGIEELIYGVEYRDMSGVDLLRENGITVRAFSPVEDN